MIKKLVSFIGVIGTISIMILSVTDHMIFLDDNVYAIWLIISFLLFLPMLICELLSLRKKKKE